MESLLSFWRNLFSQCVMDYPIYPILEMHLGKFPDPLEFQSWPVNFKTEVCANSGFPRITIHWINEVEIAKSTDDLVTSQSIERTDFPDFEMQDAKIASALRRIISSTSFRRRVSVEEQRAQEQNRFFRGRKICLHDV